MENLQAAASKTGLLDLLNHIQSRYGLIVLILVVIIGFGAVLFWSLVWKVWSATITAKEHEISRLAKERDRYQRLVFARLLTSEARAPKRQGYPNSRENTQTNETHPC